MARKITMNASSYKSVAEVFEDFVISQTAQGLSPVTLANYRHHFHSISRHLDISQSMDALTKNKLEAMVVSMRKSGLAHNSISSYCRVLRTFLGWCGRDGMSVPAMPRIKDKETVKEAYTDEELEAILKRPKKDCSFCDYRNWVIQTRDWNPFVVTVSSGGTLILSSPAVSAKALEATWFSRAFLFAL